MPIGPKVRYLNKEFNFADGKRINWKNGQKLAI